MRSVFIVFIAIALALLALIHVGIYEMIVAVFAVSSVQWLTALRILFTVLGASFIVASVLSNFFDTVATRIAYRAACVWLGFVTCMFMALVVYSIAAVIGGYAGWTMITGRALIGMAVVVGIYGIIHARHIVVTREIIVLPGLPEEWKGKTAILVSDLHLGQVRGAAFARKVTDVIGALDPDVVFIAGDLYDGVKIESSRPQF